MRYSRLACVIVTTTLAATLVAGCGPVRTETPQISPTVVPTMVRVRVGDKIISVPLEDYAIGSALSEVSPVGEDPATVERVFAVQVILARTYALAHIGRHRAEGFDLCDGTHCQLYEPARVGPSRFTAAAKLAEARTKGSVIWYGDRPIDALFHADCGGFTDAPENIWGGTPLAYLRAQKDTVPSLTHRTWQASISRETLRNALNADPKTAVGAHLDALSITTRDVSGRAAELSARGERSETLRGEDLRAAVNRVLGPKGLQSTRFTMGLTPTGYAFSGEGFGHGVGLCQAGALARSAARRFTDRRHPRPLLPRHDPQPLGNRRKTNPRVRFPVKRRVSLIKWWRGKHHPPQDVIQMSGDATITPVTTREADARVAIDVKAFQAAGNTEAGTGAFCRTGWPPPATRGPDCAALSARCGRCGRSGAGRVHQGVHAPRIVPRGIAVRGLVHAHPD